MCALITCIYIFLQTIIIINIYVTVLIFRTCNNKINYV